MPNVSISNGSKQNQNMLNKILPNASIQNDGIQNISMPNAFLPNASQMSFVQLLTKI
jgi:hypothetical protein